ncbi:MAG: hypothetical protein P4L27_13320 [Ignavibacteriaceae bacterium]|nr:hypothetical protein [Ignavibacteriaceae bacterium]
MRNLIRILYLSCFLLFGSYAFPQTFMDADNTGDAYNRITNNGFYYEVPDCVHPVRHINEEWNKDLKKFGFIFSIHVTPDNDRCINFDRQRNELKTDSNSPDSMKAFHGETLTFRWKFRLDSLFQPSSSFTHIHQIKPGDGPNQDNPVITITPRYNSSANKLQIIFISPDSITTTEYQVNLSAFQGVWVEAYEKILFSETGTYSLVIKRVSDDAVLLNYTNNNLVMWRSGTTFIRPKWGIYRSLNNQSQLRDELVRFDDFSLDKGTATNLPSAPSSLSASGLSGGRIKLTWNDNSNNEDQFRIDRSLDGTTWSYYAPAPKNVKTYTDTVTSAHTYYYRIRSENTFGNSTFSSSASYNYSPSVQLTLTALIEALFVAGLNTSMPVTPTVTVELHNATSPYALVESQTGTLSTAGVGTFSFTTAVNGTNYYIVVKSMNTVETWSATAVSFTGGALSYDFTTALNKAYTDGSADPMSLHGGKYCIYSGDLNQDGFVSGDDMTGIDNDNTNFDYHAVNDLNGDGFISGDDMTFVDNNNTNFIGKQVPPGAPSHLVEIY